MDDHGAAVTNRHRKARGIFRAGVPAKLLSLAIQEWCLGAMFLTFACFFVFPASAWCAGEGMSFPGPGEGYQITQNDSSQPTPAGYEGKTDISTRTAVGNTPTTAGKRIVATFKFGNQIKTCPQGDGTAEGDGVFSVTMDRTDAQANSTSTTHMQMLAKAKYKGQVGDDAYIKNPVMAEIDFTYDLSGSIRDRSGAIATPAGSHAAQHITIPINVGNGMAAPSFGNFSGGDPFPSPLCGCLQCGHRAGLLGRSLLLGCTDEVAHW